MERYDPEKAARVWQRVRGPQEAAAPPEDLAAIIQWERQQTHLLRQISRQLPPAAALADDCSRCAATVSGICALTGTPAPGKVPAPNREPGDRILQKCCLLGLRCCAAYERQATHREYGPVFAQLAQEKRLFCCRVLALLGNMRA